MGATGRIDRVARAVRAMAVIHWTECTQRGGGKDLDELPLAHITEVLRHKAGRGASRS